MGQRSHGLGTDGSFDLQNMTHFRSRAFISCTRFLKQASLFLLALVFLVSCMFCCAASVVVITDAVADRKEMSCPVFTHFGRVLTAVMQCVLCFVQFLEVLMHF